MSGSLWLEMTDRQSDFVLLRQFVREGRQAAFATLARRHLDLVYATALRNVGQAGGAEEIAQNVFCALARKAWQFAPDDSLPAWLHRTALLESKSWLRGELRRRRREQTAAELGTTMKAPDDQPAFSALVPLLDEALLSLREKDRTALLLRYYERQSLRDVGAALGVSDDTAQKRVRGALEKVSQFFQRCGFKTATVGATAAALQSSAGSASPTLLSSVLGAAFKVAPPALVGLGALLARLASLSRTQTVAVCVTLAAAPVAWQLNERHGAGEELKRIQTELFAAQTKHTAVQAEIERLQADSAKLEQSLAQANEAVARAAASAQDFATWKQKIRGALAAPDYRWDDASPFARIPKAILPGLSELIEISAFSPPGVVNPYASELLGLTPTERQAVEEKLRRVAQLQRGGHGEVYEMDGRASGGKLASKEFKDQPPGEVGPEAEQRFAQMLSDLRGILGEERWPALPTPARTVNCDVLNRMLIPASKAQVSASVENDENGIPHARWQFTGEVSSGGAPEPGEDSDGGNVYSKNVVGYTKGSAALSSFLPGGDAGQTTNVAGRVGGYASEAVRERVAAWFQEQARARLSGKEKP